MKDFNYTCPNGISYFEYKDYVFKQFGYTSYSSGTEDFVVDILKSLYIGDTDNFRYTNCKSDLERDFVEFVMGMLENANITDYGTSPRFSWLTQYGVDLLSPMFPDIKRKN